MADQRVAVLVVSSVLLGALVVFVFSWQRPGHQGMWLGAWPGADAKSREGLREGKLPEAARILHTQLAKLHQNSEAGSPASSSKELALRSSLGHVYRDSGNYVEAIEHYRLARDLALQLGDTEQTVVAQTALGNAYASAGKLKEARQELEAAALVMNQDGPNAVSTQWSLANVYRDSGKIDEALAMYAKVQQKKQQLEQQNQRRQQVVRRTAVQEDKPRESAAGLLSDIGQAYHSRGQLEKALLHYRQALDRHTSSGEKGMKGSGDAIELASLYNRLGQALHDQGKVAEAEEHYQKALRLQQKALRVDHPRIAETLMNIARNQQDSGEGDMAMSTIEWAERLLLGKESTPEFGGVLSMKADLLRENGRLAEAERVAKTALEAQEIIYGNDDAPEMAITLIGLGNIVHDRHEYQEAVKFYMRALAINLKTVGARHPETAATYNNLGNAYQDSGDLVAAERYYMRCLEIQKQIFEGTNPELAATYNNLATILVRQQKLHEAEELLAKAVEAARSAGLPSSSPSRAVYEENLSEVRERLGTSSKVHDHASAAATKVLTV